MLGRCQVHHQAHLVEGNIRVAGNLGQRRDGLTCRLVILAEANGSLTRRNHALFVVRKVRARRRDGCFELSLDRVGVLRRPAPIGKESSDSRCRAAQCRHTLFKISMRLRCFFAAAST